MKNGRTGRTLPRLLPARLLPLLLLLLLPPPSSPLATTAGGRAPVVRAAQLPADLPAIQDCRRSAYAGKSAALPAAQSFCNADQIQKEGMVCIVALDGGTVLGTADLNLKTNVVNNVYVREEARKRGIARSMMEAAEDRMGPGSTLKLTVMSKNVPAVGLYKSMGYAAPGVYGGLDALSSVTPFDFLVEMEKKL